MLSEWSFYQARNNSKIKTLGVIRMKKFSEKTERSLLKTLTFRILIILLDTATLLYLTKRIDITLHVISVSTLIHTLVYFLHERYWNNIHWGKHSHNHPVNP